MNKEIYDEPPVNHMISIIYEDEIKSLNDKLELLKIHYEGTIMYGNRLVDLIEWAWNNGIDIPAEVFNPCVIAIEHFRNERERLKNE